MYERFTDRARKVMQLANDEALSFGHEFLGTKHILVGLIKEGNGVAANVLKSLDLDLAKIRIEVARLTPCGQDKVEPRVLPLLACAQRSIDHAMKVAQALKHNYVGTEHLLLGMLGEEHGGGVQVLTNLGVTPEAISKEVLDLLGHGIDEAKGSERGGAEHCGTIPPIPISHEPKTDRRMYERFTDRARKVMQLANQEAQRFNHEYIGTEHVLLGLVKEGTGVAANVLKNLDVDLRKIRLEVEKLIQSGPDPLPAAEQPQTGSAKKVIEYSMEEARKLNHHYVGTEHILLGLIRVRDGVAAQVLTNLGLTPVGIRQEVLALLAHGIEGADRVERGSKRRGTIPPIPVSHHTKTGGSMYTKFTDRARKVMQLANQEAQRFNHEYIGTEHLLLGLIREGSGVAANVLKNLDVDLRKIRLELEKIIQSGPDIVTTGKLPQTPRAKKVIEYAMEEARGLNHNYVGTEHILLGLLREQEGIGAQILMNLGLKLEEVRAEVLNLLGQGKAGTLLDRGILPPPQTPEDSAPAMLPLMAEATSTGARQRPTGSPNGTSTGPRLGETSIFELKNAVIGLSAISLALGSFYLAGADRGLTTPGAILFGAGIIALALARR